MKRMLEENVAGTFFYYICYIEYIYVVYIWSWVRCRYRINMVNFFLSHNALSIYICVVYDSILYETQKVVVNCIICGVKGDQTWSLSIWF